MRKEERGREGGSERVRKGETWRERERDSEREGEQRGRRNVERVRWVLRVCDMVHADGDPEHQVLRCKLEY